MTDSNPRIGEKTPLYPFGYGFCQCGCRRITRLNPDGIWASYIEGHEAIWELSSADRPQKDRLSEQFDLEFVEAKMQGAVESTASGQLDSKLGREKKDSIGVKRKPSFGQKTRFYPFGYGYCQCGCKGVAEQFPSGTYPMYVPGHHSSDTNPKSQNSTGEGNIRLMDPAALKAGERLTRVSIKQLRPTLSPKSFVAPERPLLELYLDLVRKHELLELQIEGVRLDIENTITLVKNLWRGSASEKQFVVEKLQAVLNALKTTR